MNHPLGSFKNEGEVTSGELREMALDSRTGLASGLAGGWSVVLSRPGYQPEKLTDPIRYWCLSARRVDGLEPSDGDLFFLRGFVLAAGGPDVPGANVVAGGWYWTWLDAKTAVS